MSVKNLVVGIVQLGRISIGKTVEKNGKNLPEKTDSIRITGNSMVNKAWVDHPVMTGLVKKEGEKLRSIPVRVLFDHPANNLQNSYSCFDTKGRQVCVGDGATAKRREGGGISDVPCPGPEFCPFGQQNRCKLFARLTVGIDVGDAYEENPSAGFVFRSTGWNSVKALSSQLAVFSAACGGKMAGFPATLVLRAKSSSASMKSMFYYLDLVPRDGLLVAVTATLARRARLVSAGVEWDAVEDVVAAGLASSAFAEDGENGQAIVQEFFAEEVDPETGEVVSGSAHPGSGSVEPVLSEGQVDIIKAGLQRLGRSIASLNTWLGRPEDAPLATMGLNNLEKVASALGLTPAPVVSAPAPVPVAVSAPVPVPF